MSLRKEKEVVRVCSHMPTGSHTKSSFQPKGPQGAWGQNSVPVLGFSQQGLLYLWRSNLQDGISWISIVQEKGKPLQEKLPGEAEEPLQRVPGPVQWTLHELVPDLAGGFSG